MPEVAAALGTANYIGGKWRQSRSGRTYERGNPWRPSEVVGEFPRSDADDVGEAVAAAERAWPAWSRTPAAQRCAFLARAAGAIESRVEDIAKDMTREMGKPLRESRLEAARAAAIFRYFSGEGWRALGQVYEQSATGATVYTRRRPLGVVGLITPWGTAHTSKDGRRLSSTPRRSPSTRTPDPRWAFGVCGGRCTNGCSGAAE